MVMISLRLVFQSTLPRGSDYNPFQCLPAANHFNPRSLAGATRRSMRILYCASTFQSTLPRGSDNLVFVVERFLFPISIHAPSRERLEIKSLIARLRHFNPRSLAGATANVGQYISNLVISIHAPSRERQNYKYNIFSIIRISIHAPSRERLLSTWLIFSI